MMNLNQQSVTSSDNAERIVSAMERILRPVIRLFVGRISCDFMVQQIKRIYIEEARQWIKRNDADSRVTKSKLAMLTGLDTRTIAAIENSPSVENFESEICAEAAVLYRWSSQADYHNAEGKPDLLPIMGRSSSFQSLVTSAVGRNVTYHTLLDRLLESGNVEIFDDNFVRLVNAYYQPIKSSEQVFVDFGSRSISRLANTIVLNMNASSSSERRLQQDRWSRHIPEDKLPELSNEVRALIESQIIEIENIIDRYEVSENHPNTCKFGVGWYVFS